MIIVGGVMMLYNKYKPKSFSEMIGNADVMSVLSGYVSAQEIPHCLLFHGERGCGKSSSADIIAKAIPNAYISVIDASVTNGVEVSRTLASRVNDVPIGYENVVYILEEIHNVSDKFYDALLTVTNDPPEHCYFIIATTEIKKVRDTIRSRFIKFEFKPPSLKEIKKYLQCVVDQEGMVVSNSIINTICINNSRIPRDCMTTLELLQNVSSTNSQLELIGSKIVDESGAGYQLAKLLLEGNKWGKMVTILKEVDNTEVEGIRRVVCNYVMTCMFGGANTQKCSLILDSFSKEFNEPQKASLVLACYENI